MKLTNAQGVLDLIRLANRTPQSYRQLIICSPFVSESLLRTKVAPNRVIHVPTFIITRPETARQLALEWKKWNGTLIIIAIPNLHAKAYLACGRDDRDSVAILGSFNVTMAALDENVELGVQFVGNTPESRELITTLERKLMGVTLLKPNGGTKL
jgi:hypothetical protein